MAAEVDKVGAEGWTFGSACELWMGGHSGLITVGARRTGPGNRAGGLNPLNRDAGSLDFEGAQLASSLESRLGLPKWSPALPFTPLGRLAPKLASRQCGHRERAMSIDGTSTVK